MTPGAARPIASSERTGTNRYGAPALNRGSARAGRSRCPRLESPRPAAISASDGRRDIEPLGQLRQLEISGQRAALAMARDADDVADLLLEHDPQILSGQKIAGAAVRDQRSRLRLSDGRRRAIRASA